MTYSGEHLSNRHSGGPATSDNVDMIEYLQCPTLSNPVTLLAVCAGFAGLLVFGAVRCKTGRAIQQRAGK